jgi:hypothetical protein
VVREVFSGYRTGLASLAIENEPQSFVYRLKTGIPICDQLLIFGISTSDHRRPVFLCCEANSYKFGSDTDSGWFGFSVYAQILAEKVGFEPTERSSRSSAFKADALNHSATFPCSKWDGERRNCTCLAAADD